MEETQVSMRQLAERVFAVPERWGWEFRSPEAARPAPNLAAEPLWAEPSKNTPATVKAQLARQAAPKRGVICGVILIIGIALTKYGIVLDLIALGLAAFWFWPLIANAQASSATSARDRDYARYQENWKTWRASVESWIAGERARIASADLWFPVSTATQTRRVDVFGGTPDGWAALIATLGGSALQSGASVLILDLSDEDVAYDLAGLSGELGRTVTHLELPAQLAGVDLISGLEPEEIAEVVAQAVQSLREAGQADLRALDADLIRTVASQLAAPVTFRKLTAGLQVLRRRYDDLSGPPVLSPAELQGLTGYVDMAGQDDQVQRELQFLASCVDLLGSTAEAPDRPPAELWTPGLVVLRTAERNPRRKDLTDRVLVESLTHRLRTRFAGSGGDVLVLAGADHLGLAALEALSRAARRSGLRTVFMLEHLRGDLQQLLGGSDSASFIMRLGNAQEATSAAEYIGRGHKFVLNQITRQLSDAKTDGEAKTWGATSTFSDTHSVSGGSSGSQGGGGWHKGWSRSTGFSRSDTWSRTVNWSTTTTTSDGTTVSRVYEFAVEPTEIQSLPTTAFLLVEAAGGIRRMAAGDCNPGIMLLDRLSSPAPPAVSAEGGMPLRATGQPSLGAGRP
jgi:hypothetical protein